MTKFKTIPDDYYITILDRLTRFEPACVRYERVFNDLISKFCLDKIQKDISIWDKITLTEELLDFNLGSNSDNSISSILTDLEGKYFEFNEVSYQYLSARLNYSGMLEKINFNSTLPKNLLWLKEINPKASLVKQRDEKSLLYPIEKIILCEGQTEFVLLKTLFNILGYNLDNNGVLVLQAGGKNQVARKYYKMIDYVKTPFFVLLDKDGEQIKSLIERKLRKIDKIYLIQNGEFEDIIPINILLNTINSTFEFQNQCVYDDFFEYNSMVKNLENIYKKYGFGEFKKAQFAQNLNNYLLNNVSAQMLLDSEIVNILNALK